MVLAWHFLRKQDGRHVLRNGPEAPADGVVLEHTGPIVLCESGLHASIVALDALRYAPGSILCRVKCSMGLLHEKDKLVCRQRKIVARADVTEELRSFSRKCALDVAHLWLMPDIVRQYLETGDESIRAAAGAAAEAAGAAAGAAAEAAGAAEAAAGAAWAAAGAAAEAARAAAGAAWAAAEAAAGAAWAAAREEQSAWFEKMMLKTVMGGQP